MEADDFDLPKYLLQYNLVIFGLICEVIKSRDPFEITAVSNTTRKVTIIVVIFKNFMDPSIYLDCSKDPETVSLGVFLNKFQLYFSSYLKKKNDLRKIIIIISNIIVSHNV